MSAEISRLLRLDDIENRLANPPEPVVITEELPTEAVHGWRYIGFNPDGKLYITIGMPCNVCQQSDQRYGTITRMDPDGLVPMPKCLRAGYATVKGLTGTPLTANYGLLKMVVI